MINTDMIDAYLLWKRDKELYPPQWTPNDWTQEILMSEGYARINLLKDLLENNTLDPVEFANEVHDIIYQPLEELMNDAVPMDTSGEV